MNIVMIDVGDKVVLVSKEDAAKIVADEFIYGAAYLRASPTVPGLHERIDPMHLEPPISI